MNNTNKTVELLKLNGIKPSPIRVAVMNYLLNSKEHPTADMIFTELSKHSETLSKTSIYNVLGLFIEKKLAFPRFIEGGETRYDAVSTEHGHFKCRICGSVIDFEIKAKNLEFNGLDGFTVDKQDVYCYGTCNKCLTSL